MFTKIKSGTYSINKFAAVIAEVALAAMMLITVGDVIGRYFFNSPIKGTFEIVGLLLVCAGTWGWGYCQIRKGHISVSILTDRFPLKARTFLKYVAYIFGLVVFSLLCWQTLLLAWKYLFLPQGGVTSTLAIPYFPFILALAISSGLMALTLLIEFVIELVQLFAEAKRKWTQL